MLSYGASALVKSVTEDILSDLLKVFPANEAYSIMSMATLKVIKSSVTLGRISTHYKWTFVSRDCPGAALSKNMLGSLLQRIGANQKSRSTPINKGFGATFLIYKCQTRDFTTGFRR